jgi:hypothetical protein
MVKKAAARRPASVRPTKKPTRKRTRKCIGDHLGCFMIVWAGNGKLYRKGADFLTFEGKCGKV